MRGRKPKPSRLRVIEGNPGKRALNTREPRPAVRIPTCPAHLSPSAKAECQASAKAEAIDKPAQHRQMQAVERLPRQFAATHPIHCRTIAGAPGIGELAPVSAHAMRSPETRELLLDAAAPIDNGAENVEQKRCRTLARRRPRHQKSNPVWRTGPNQRRCAAQGPCSARAARCSGVE